MVSIQLSKMVDVSDLYTYFIVMSIIYLEHIRHGSLQISQLEGNMPSKMQHDIQPQQQAQTLRLV